MAITLKKFFILSLLVSTISIIIGLLAQLVLPPQIPLFYGLPQTAEQLAPAILIILPSVVSLLITTINMFFLTRVHDIYLKKSLAFVSIAVSILAIITTLKIIFLVGSI